MARYDRVLRSARSPTYAQPGHDEGMPRGEMVVSLHVTLAPSPCFALQLRITLQFSRVGTTQRTADPPPPHPSAGRMRTTSSPPLKEEANYLHASV